GRERVVQRLRDQRVRRHDALAGVAFLAVVLLGVERVLRLHRLAQLVVGLCERNRLDPRHQASSRRAVAARRGCMKKRYTGTPAPTTRDPSSAWRGLDTPSRTSISRSIA